MELIDILEPQCCSVTQTARKKEAALKALAGLAMKSERIGDLTQDAIVRQLADREAEGSTAYGGGIAIPHARIEGLKDFIVVVAVIPRGVDFDALDGKRVRLFTMILGPAERTHDYLKLLAMISRLLMNARLRRELLRAATSDALYETLVRWSRPGQTKTDQESHVLLTVVLYEEQLLHQLLGTLIEMGIEGATLLESQGMNEYISQVPIYAEMIQFMHTRKSRSKTILTIVPEARVDAIMDAIEDVTGNLDQVEGAVMFAQNLRNVRGTMRMLE